MAKRSASTLGGDDYRRGALERLRDAAILLGERQFAGSVYAAGRAVEGMLRAVIWIKDPTIARGNQSLDTGHDLRLLLTRVQSLTTLWSSNRIAEALRVDIQYIARLWSNHFRYVSSKYVETAWYNLDEVNKRFTLKQAAAGFYDSCENVVKRLERLCQK